MTPEKQPDADFPWITAIVAYFVFSKGWLILTDLFSSPGFL